MRKYLLIIICCATFGVSFAQQRSITGRITDASDSSPITSATVRVEGGIATQSDANGQFAIQANEGAVLIITSIGYDAARIPVTSASTYSIQLNPTAEMIGEVVVTALGISREKRSLGYSSQEVSGEDLTSGNQGNVTSALSGKVAGLQIRTNTGMGGSANIVIRGNKSLTGDNQALFVIDGVPVDNSREDQGSNSFDFGNLASDLNPDDIESINVLKGAAATALYGSRAANGAIIITTKTGKKSTGKGISFTTGYNIGLIDKTTFPEYQMEYGASYGPINGPGADTHFNYQDMDGDGILDPVTPFNQYAGFGAAYDPNLLVYQWVSQYPESKFYQTPTPWVPVSQENGPLHVFQPSQRFNNNLAFAGNNDKGSYRLSYSNSLEGGVLPNAKMGRHSVSLNSSLNVTDRMTVSGNVNYTYSKANGRTERGMGSNYSNPMITFRQYWQPNIDMRDVQEIYESSGGKNITQFPGGTIDNVYYVLAENKQSDHRHRIIGNVAVDYKLLSWLDFTGRVSLDTYNNIMEDRQNTLIRTPSRYSIRNSSRSEVNYDFMLNYNKDIMEGLNASGVVGTNIRRSTFQSIYNATNSGLIVERLYAISNSLGTPPPASERYTREGVNGYYGALSLGYKRTYYLDLTGRVDQASTLPLGANSFFYPSIAASVIFSEFIGGDVLSFGKLRLNYAEVGNSARPLSISDVLDKPIPFGSIQRYSVNNTKNNAYLKPERTESYEVGIETSFLKNRVSFNASYYRTNTKDQIMPVSVTPATGYTSKYVNAGEVENKGVELHLSGRAIVSDGFNWEIDLNWAMNKSKVLSLYEGVDNLLLSSIGTSNMSLNAPVGHSFGTFFGPDFVYVNGQRVVDQSTGKYVRSANSDNILGKMLPDWNAGLQNSFSYHSLSLRFLIDMQKGGSIYSEDMAVGSRNGLYSNTVGLNDLGNPMRDPISAGGGIILDGVAPDGTKNTVRTEVVDRNHALGIPTAPGSMFLYDASYIKLREVAVSYNLPRSVVNKLGVNGLQVSAVGSNLWIIQKHTPHADPEAGLASGNLQGFQNGVYPALRNFGVNLRLTL